MRVAIVSLFTLILLAGHAAGQVSWCVNPDGFIVLRNEWPDRGFAILDFISPGGHLVPIPGGNLAAASANPFSFLLVNSPPQVTYANLGIRTAAGHEVVMTVGYSGDDPEHEVSLSWSFGGHLPVIAPFDPVPCDARVPDVSGIIGNDGSIRLEGDSVNISRLEFLSGHRQLIPSSTGRLIDVDETTDLERNLSNQILFDSGMSLDLDGALSLDIGYQFPVDDPRFELSAVWFEEGRGAGSVRFVPEPSSELFLLAFVLTIPRRRTSK